MNQFKRDLMNRNGRVYSSFSILECASCKIIIDRDINASKNILHILYNYLNNMERPSWLIRWFILFYFKTKLFNFMLLLLLFLFIGFCGIDCKKLKSSTWPHIFLVTYWDSFGFWNRKNENNWWKEYSIDENQQTKF